MSKASNFIFVVSSFTGMGIERSSQQVLLVDSQKSSMIETQPFLEHYHLGLTLMENDQLDNASIAFQRSVELNPKFVEGFANLGVVSSRQGKVDEAIATFKRSIELSPTFAHGYVGLGFNLLVKRQYAEADIVFRQAISLNPDLPTAFEGLSRSLVEQERFSEAVAYLYRASELNLSLETYNSLGLSLLHSRQWNEAAVAFQQAIKLDPHCSQSQKGLAIAQRLSKEMIEIPDVEIISVHIPKTAGSTFRYCFLENMYGGDQILHDYDSLNLEDNLIKIKPQTKVIHGHFHASKYINCFPEAKLITWLRHPFDYLISWYCYWLTLPRTKDARHRYVLEHKPSFREFINLPFTFNSVSGYYLKGVDLSRFYFIGIQEFFEADLEKLKGLLGQTDLLTCMPAKNVNTYPGYKSLKEEILKDEELIELMTRHNSEDLALYQTVLELRQKRENSF